MKKTAILSTILACLSATAAYAEEPKVLNPAEAIPELTGKYKIIHKNEYVRNGQIDKYGIALGFSINLYDVERNGKTTYLYVKPSNSKPELEEDCISGEILKDGYCYKLLEVNETANGKYTLKQGKNEIKIERM